MNYYAKLIINKNILLFISYLTLTFKYLIKLIIVLDNSSIHSFISQLKILLDFLLQ